VPLLGRVNSHARRRGNGDEGFTMVELVVAMFIFGIVVVGIGVGMSSSLNLTRQNRNRSVAANVASQAMDTVRSTDFSDLDNMTQQPQPTTTTQTVEGVTYTLSQYTRWITQGQVGSSTGPCQTPPTATNPLAYIAVTTTVSWNGMQGVPPVASSTVVTPPVGLYDSTDGNLSVTVLNASGAPVSGANVEIDDSTGAAVDTGITSSNGCVFFAFEPADLYTVLLSSVTGYVDGSGNPSPTQTATVKASSTTSVQFLFDRASSLNVTMGCVVTCTGYTIPTGIPVTLGNTHLIPSGVLRLTSPTGNPRTLPNLFPYTDGYQPWGGGCADADPASTYVGGSRPAAVAMTPGGASSATVTLPIANLGFKRSSGSGTYTITATHTAASDTGCPTPETYTLATAQSITTTTTSIKTALPYGQWTITWKNTSSSVTGSQTINLTWTNNSVTPTTATVT